MDDNSLSMIILAFISGCIFSLIIKWMCRGRLVEGNASPGPTTAPEQTTPQTKINELASPATMTTDIQGKTCEACTCRMNEDKTLPEWCCVTKCLDRQLFDDKFCSNPYKDEPDRDVNLDKYLRDLPDEDIYKLNQLYT
jgi:hypothetical protein